MEKTVNQDPKSAVSRPGPGPAPSAAIALIGSPLLLGLAGYFVHAADTV